MKSQKVILLIGGNEAETIKTIEKALVFIRKEIGQIKSMSGIYQTAAWGPIPQSDYLNVALLLSTNLPPVYLLKRLLSIETRLGRRRSVKYGPRTIDIDLLYYGSQVINHKDLIVPHPQLQNRKFVLLPCNEIAPGYIHPVLKKNTTQLLEVCKDNLDVKLWTR